MAQLELQVKAEPELKPQPCHHCGTLIMDFHQWFSELCRPETKGEHIVEDWLKLPFDGQKES